MKDSRPPRQAHVRYPAQAPVVLCSAAACWKGSLESGCRWDMVEIHDPALGDLGLSISPLGILADVIPVVVAKLSSCRVTGTHAGHLEGSPCLGTRAVRRAGPGREEQLGASHCGLSVLDFQVQRLYKSNWWIIKLR